MKIALLSTLPPDKNGIANYAEQFRIAMISTGVNVELPLVNISELLSLDDALKFVENYNWDDIDLVHAEIGGGRIREFLMLKALIIKYPNLPLTATVHDPERLIWRPDKLIWPLRSIEKINATLQKICILINDPITLKNERIVAQNLTHIITLTQLGGTNLAKKMRLLPEKMTVIPHGNKDIAMKPLPKIETLRLLYFGFIYRGKGIEDLLNALKIALDSTSRAYSSVTLTIAGGISPLMAFKQDGNYLEELKDKISSIGLKETINWNIDVVDEDIPRLIQDHHCMILPYQESKKIKLLGNMTGTSGALSWAIACGRGVITSDARSFAEEVSSGNGLVYSQGNVIELSNNLISIFKEPEVLERWAEKAHSIAQERVWSKTANKFSTLFRQLITKD